MNKLVAISAAVAMPTAAPALPAEFEHSIDPIFAALDGFRFAEAEFYADRSGNIPDEVGDRWSEALDVVIRTQPTTPAGLAALTGFARDMAERSNRNDAGLPDGEWVTVMATIDAATRGMSGLKAWSPPALLPVGPHPDRELFNLTDRYVTALDEYSDCALAFDEIRSVEPRPRGYVSKERAYKRTMKNFGKIEREMAGTRAITLGGLQVKAYAVDVDPGVSQILPKSIVEDLLGMVSSREIIPPVKKLPARDKELIALGEKFESLVTLEEPLRKECERLSEAADRLRYERMGVDPDDKTACDVAAKDRWSEWLSIRRETGAAVGCNHAYRAWNAASEKTGRIGKKILRLKAESAQGLLIKARVIETHDEIGEDEPADQLMEEIRRFAAASV